MRIVLAILAVMFVATSAFAADPMHTTGTHAAVKGEYTNHCAWGLTQGKQVMTDCHINWKDDAGKTYCFSSEEAKANWAKDTKGNMAKATTEYTKAMAAAHTGAHTGTMTK